MVREPELTEIELHLLWCQECVRRAHDIQDYVDAMRAAIIQGNFDLDPAGDV